MDASARIDAEPPLSPLEALLRRLDGTEVTLKVKAQASGMTGQEIVDAIRDYERANTASWRA